MGEKRLKEIVQDNKIKGILILLFILLIGLFLYIKLSRIVTSTGESERAILELPEGAIARLSSNSKISYAPYWWTQNREIKCEGEIFFSIDSEKEFVIRTSELTIRTKRSEFNVKSHDDINQVYCKTGDLQVETLISGKVALSDSQFVSLDDQMLDIEEISEKHVLGWRKNKFVYDNFTLDKILIEFKRYYNIYISWGPETARKTYYTGVLDRALNPEAILDSVCTDVNLVCRKEATDTFRILVPSLIFPNN